MRHWVSIYIALGTLITLDLSDKALGAKLARYCLNYCQLSFKSQIPSSSVVIFHFVMACTKGVFC
ncbi:hypothetical protein V6Z11_D02G139800 [Gossypium hirsutum]